MPAIRSLRARLALLVLAGGVGLVIALLAGAFAGASTGLIGGGDC